jgi:NitT/TauT family transport system permease protein
MRTTIAFHDKKAQQEQNRTQSPRSIANTKRLKRRQALFINIARVLLLVCLIVVWQLVSGPVVNPLFISSPLAVAVRFEGWIGDGTLWFHTAITLQETLLGLIFGIISGVLAGFLFGIQPVLAKIFDPFVTAVYSIPKIALAPLFILWFGIDIEMKIIFAAVTVFFLVFFNTLAGVRNVDQNLIDAVLLMGGKPRDIMLKVVVPSAMGSVLTGVHIAIPYALVGAVIGELIASNRGLGYLIDSSATSFDTAGVFAALLVLTIMAAILNAIVNFIDRKTSRWKATVSMGKEAVP